ncbi:hypothetical protein, partial [Rhodopirellula bahusiensis]|uniref:hypothetical protein n=1 Tax=Rhodopirellula bahusiensis TaxID=2014065 RepID=UPI0032659D77
MDNDAVNQKRNHCRQQAQKDLLNEEAAKRVRAEAGKVNRETSACHQGNEDRGGNKTTGTAECEDCFATPARPFCPHPCTQPVSR